MKKMMKFNAVVLVFSMIIVLTSMANVLAAVDPDVGAQTPPVITGRQLMLEKIAFLLDTLKERIAQLPEGQRPVLALGDDFGNVSGLEDIEAALLDPDHPLHDAVAKAGELHQRAQVRPALADDANRFLNLAILDTLDQLLANPSIAGDVRNTLFALIDLLKELELPEAYQAPDTRYTFTGLGRPDDRDRIERVALVAEDDDDPVDPVDPPAPETGFKYYGRPYDLATDVSVDPRGFIVFGDGQIDTSFIDVASLSLDNNMPASLSPFFILPVITENTDVYPLDAVETFSFFPTPVSLTVDYIRLDVTDLRYTYNWAVKADTLPVMSTSASLYRNDWIVFDYESVEGEGGDFLFDNLMLVIAGLSPGDGSTGSGHPGEGEPRDWVSGGDFVSRTLLNNASLSFDGSDYTAIYSDADLSLADAFFIFRPYEWVDGVYTETPNKYTVTAGTRKILAAGLASLDEAIGLIIDDVELLKTVDEGEFLNDPLQTATSDDPATAPGYALIDSSAFLAYAVQVEEDIVNREILEMYDRATENVVQDTVLTSKGFAAIRDRDAFFTEKADAQAGRVLKDHNGDWVRVQQYVLRAGDNSVKFLSASLRNVDNEPSLSTLDFTTTIREKLPANIVDLPWDLWLDTKIKVKNDTEFKYVLTPELDPLLESMSVTIESPGQTFQEVRTFAEGLSSGIRQYITSETLTITGVGEFVNAYSFSSGVPLSADVDYRVNGGIGGFSYEFAGRDPVNVSLFELSDSGAVASDGTYKDIWDALRVGESGGPVFGDDGQALEIVINDGAADAAFAPFDVLYIPMSRMIWKDGGSGDEPVKDFSPEA